VRTHQAVEVTLRGIVGGAKVVPKRPAAHQRRDETWEKVGLPKCGRIDPNERKDEGMSQLAPDQGFALKFLNMPSSGKVRAGIAVSTGSNHGPDLTLDLTPPYNARVIV
jgi:hypothetical protein